MEVDGTVAHLNRDKDRSYGVPPRNDQTAVQIEKNKSHARKFMMAAKALFQLLLIALVRIMTIYPARASNIPRHSVNADIISLEEYGIVFKPGRLMSTSDVTHIQQGFLIEIPRRERRTDEMTAA